MKPLTWDTQRRVNLSPRFILEHPAWKCSPLATKLFLWLFSKANHDPVSGFDDGETVARGQYRHSLRRLAAALHVRDPRFVRKALLELERAGCISLSRRTQQSVASHAVASDALRDRKSQLITINGFNGLGAAVASDAAESTYYVSSRERRRTSSSSSLTAHDRHEITLNARAQMLSERLEIPLAEARRRLEAEPREVLQ